MHINGFITFLVLVCLADGSSDLDRCPVDKANSRFYMTTFRDTCYMFVDVEKTWVEARSHCWRAGGEMVIIRDEETMNLIKKTLSSRELGWSRNGVWNGASDLRNRGWEWTTGEKLSDTKYQYWAPNEPKTSIFGISIENCCCMRRSEQWRWHDYHCNSEAFHTYNFICQFAMQEPSPGGAQQHNGGEGSGNHGGAPLTVQRDEKGAIIALLITCGLLLLIVCVVVYYLYKKHERQKQRHPVLHYQPRSFSTGIQDSRTPPNQNGSTRPISNIYLEPSEINNYAPPEYEQIAKESNSRTPPTSTGQSEDTVPLVYVGGAASAENLSSPSSVASGATSGYCSHNTMERRNDNDEYVEMSGDFRNGNKPVSKVKPIVADPDYMNSDCCGGVMSGGAKGTGKDIKPSNTNIYASPMTISDYILENGDSILAKPKKTDTPEVHIYTNKLDEVTGSSQRPLPPVPTDSV